MALSAMLVGAAITIIGMVAITTAHAQKAEKGTQHWTINVPGPVNHALHVFDMSGACLYVYEEGGVGVLSKSQLPVGTGCQ